MITKLQRDLRVVSTLMEIKEPLDDSTKAFIAETTAEAANLLKTVTQLNALPSGDVTGDVHT